MKLRVPHPLWILTVAVALGVVAGGVGVGVPAYRQWSAMNELQPYIYFDHGRHVGPEWLRRLVGEQQMNAFDDIETIQFRCDDVRYDRMFGVKREPFPKHSGAVINDNAVANIKSFSKLKGLGLSCTDVTDVGMTDIVGLQKLEYLDLSGTDISDASVPLIKQLSNLKDLSLRRTRVNDAGVDDLQRALPDLKIER
jgi:hypothetical protein